MRQNIQELPVIDECRQEQLVMVQIEDGKGVPTLTSFINMQMLNLKELMLLCLQPF